MNFFKKVFGYSTDLASQIQKTSFDGTLYRVLDNGRNVIFHHCKITFESQQDQKYLIKFQNTGQNSNTQDQCYVLPFHIDMKPVSFVMLKNQKQNACIEWIMDQDQNINDHIGCYLNLDKKDQFVDIFCKILKAVFNDQNIKNHLDLIKQLAGIPVYKSMKQSKTSSNISNSKLKNSQKFNQLLLVQAHKDQNKFVHTASCYQIIRQQKKLIQDSVIMTIVKKQDKFQIQVINSMGYPFIVKQLTKGLTYQVNTDQGYFKWLQFQEKSNRIIQINFGKRDAAMTLKFAITDCLFELNNKKSIRQSIEQDQLLYMRNISQKPKFSQQINKKIVKNYEERQILSIGQQSFIYDNKQAHKGLQKYRNLCQAKIDDFSIASLGRQLELLKISSDNSIVRKQKIKILPHNKDNLGINQILLHDNDTKTLLLDQNGKMYYQDLQTGSIVQQYDLSNKGIKHVCPEFKLAQTTNFKTFKAISPNTIYQIDPRIKDKQSKLKSYETKTQFCKISVNGKGNFAIGSQSGEIRLFDQIGKRSNCNINSGLGDPVTHLESTKDGKWLLATFKKYILLVPTETQDQISLYLQKTKVQSRPNPIKLILTVQDIQLLKIENQDLIPARFDQRKNNTQRFIISGIGQYAIVWSMEQLLKGKPKPYKFAKVPGNMVQAQFRFNDVHKLIMTTTQGITIKQNKIIK